MKTRKAILLFARSPEREAMAKGIPGSAALFRAVVGRWLQEAARVGAVPILACEERDRASLASIEPAIPRQWAMQGSGPFAERVFEAAGLAVGRGFNAVIVAAIDAPPPSDLDSVFSIIASGRTVVAPARDGGVNFIGFRGVVPTVLAELHPRRRDLVQLCIARIDDVVVLPAVTDIDSRGALQRAVRERQWDGYLAERVTTPRVECVLPSLAGIATGFHIRPPPLG